METLLKSIGQTVENEHFENSRDAKRFNIFSILNITTDEVRLHSRFLAELLNPLGLHDQGTMFLEQFLQNIKAEDVFPNLLNVKSSIEYPIGQKTEITGGRIDILLIDNLNNAVIIENKIYASDQENQLLRYFNFGEVLISKGGKFKLLYLTLFDKDASENSKVHLKENKDYYRYTYHTTILFWLKDCMKKVWHLPKISITLEHYIQLLETLTYQNYSTQMEEKVINEIIKNKQNFVSSMAIQSNLLDAKIQLLGRVGTKLKERINAANGPIKTVFQDVNFGQQYNGLELFLSHGESDPNNRPVHIRISFLSHANDCYLEIHPGIVNKQIQEKDINRQQYLNDILKNYFSVPNVKIMDTYGKWQGEWVARYSKLDNKFIEIIENEDILVDDVFNDITFLIARFQESVTKNYVATIDN